MKINEPTPRAFTRDTKRECRTRLNGFSARRALRRSRVNANDGSKDNGSVCCSSRKEFQATCCHEYIFERNNFTQTPYNAQCWFPKKRDARNYQNRNNKVQKNLRTSWKKNLCSIATRSRVEVHVHKFTIYLNDKYKWNL